MSCTDCFNEHIEHMHNCTNYLKHKDFIGVKAVEVDFASNISSILEKLER